MLDRGGEMLFDVAVVHRSAGTTGLVLRGAHQGGRGRRALDARCPHRVDATASIRSAAGMLNNLMERT